MAEIKSNAASVEFRNITKIYGKSKTPAVDGISLTIADLLENSAVFWITPHTWEHTHLRAAVNGQTVNLEADLLAKHVDKLLSSRVQGA